MMEMVRGRGVDGSSTGQPASSMDAAKAPQGRRAEPSASGRRPRVAIYSHDTMGLGHLRRNLLIAWALTKPPLQADALWITGVHESRFFHLPAHVDCLSLPALWKREDGSYQPRRLRIGLPELIRLRSAIICTALERFQPDVLLVDSVPRGALRELDPSLQMLRLAGTRCVLGLRDIGDAPEVVRREWKDAENELALRRYYDRVWVYGDAGVYDRIRRDGMDSGEAGNACYTGYLDQRERLRIPDGQEPPREPEPPFVLCAVGGGQDGRGIAETFAAAELPRGVKGVLLTGPYMPPGVRRGLAAAAAGRRDLELIEFHPEPTRLVQRAERVIAMGGYNSVCEILSFNKRALLVPRVTPRREQLIRAQRFQELGLIDMLHPEELSTRRLSAWLNRKNEPPPRLRERVDLNGLACLPALLSEMLPGGRGSRGGPLPSTAMEGS